MIVPPKKNLKRGKVRKRNFKWNVLFSVLIGLLIFSGPTYSEIKTGHPIIVSESRVDLDGDGLKEIIQIVLEKGRRYRDQEPWCGNGEKWEGLFTIRLVKNNRVLTRQSLNALMNPEAPEEELFFWLPRFTLVFEDYNGDGRVDFNLGQYGNCNGNLYRLFSIAKEGTFERLPVAEAEGFFISKQGRRNSTAALKVGDKVTTFSYYDNTLGKTVTARYAWNGRAFERLAEKGGGQ